MMSTEQLWTFALITVVAVGNFAHAQQCSRLVGWDIHSGRQTLRSGYRAEQCCGLCRQDTTCKGYAWNSWNGGTCYLKTDASNLVRALGVTSGVLERSTSTSDNGNHGFDANCLRCMCKIESRCTNMPCRMDLGSLSCGYYQIKRNYYLDCGQPDKRSGESTDSAWKRCAANKNCSVRCMRAYINRYRHLCPNKPECEMVARIHNGGPHGCQRLFTNVYWNKMQQCL